jgi:hypothetical protein
LRRRYLEGDGREENDWETLDVLGRNVHFFGGVHHAHVSEVGASEGKHEVVIDHLFGVFLGLWDKLVFGAVVEQSLIEIAQH